MKICVIGSGYVGLVSAACLADFGNQVICIDKNTEKIRKLKEAKIDFFELGLTELVRKNLKAKRLSFSSLAGLDRAVKSSEIIFIAVGTPPLPNGDADLSAVLSVARKISEALKAMKGLKAKAVAIRSTVPVGTSDKVAALIGQRKVFVVSNPEFLREGHAVYDFLHPDRIVVGSDGKAAGNIMGELYRPLNARMIFIDRRSAELVKYASNAFLATRISFINEIANICESTGANIRSVVEGLGYDKRIGQAYLRAGIGFGGSCLPKDIAALIHLGAKNNCDTLVMKSIAKVNQSQREFFVAKIKRILKEVKGKKIAIWGVAFKPQTDDLRDAPALFIIEELLKAGARLRIYDPIANAKAKLLFPQAKYFNSSYEAAKGTDAVVIITEWNEFREIDFDRFKLLMRHPLIIDGRNIFDPKVLDEAGIRYYGIGVKNGYSLKPLAKSSHRRVRV
ncbi:MAG: UDP-glucose/GDP-mannose dehydrogenase family protein [Candidatus Saganbacteria bacterium]|nr:UDP-glucose/GDP-mannose dehydrogenase family protein [Candidatus Saganbacteria bacterium]